MNNCRILLIIALYAVFTLPVRAADRNDFARDKGLIVRVGAGAPTNLNVGVGFQFNPHFSLTADVFSYSGLTAITGAIDARSYILDYVVTPFIAVKVGYGTLGEGYDCKKYHDFTESATVGISWRGFDLGAGVIYDSFHNFAFITNISWTFRF